jgi:RecB family exonuclease
MDGDKFFLPSLYISHGEPVEATVKGILSEEERLTLPPANDFRAKEIKDLHVIRKDSTLRVTDIDSYGRCPRKHLLEKVFGLSPSEVQDYEIEARELGTIVHRVMEKLVSGPVPELDEFRNKAETVLDDVLGSSGLNDYFKSLLRETFLDSLENIHALEKSIAEEGYTPAEMEMDVSCTLRGVSLKGKVDRMDTGADGSVSLIDYKTGASNISGPAALRGEDIQIFVYAAMLESLGRSPARVGIYSLKDIKVKWVPNSRDLKKGEDLSTFINAAAGHLENTASAIFSGDYSASPKSDQICRNCHERPYCPYITGLEEASNA